MNIDFTALTPAEAYHLMTQTIVPRPIAWILTENESGTDDNKFNLAPFSFFNSVAANPPTLMVSIGVQPDGRIKDTLANIQRTGKLVIHISSAQHIEALNQSAATLPYGESELTASMLGTTPMNNFSLPRLSVAKVAFACELDHTHLIGEAPQTLVFAQVKSAYIADDCVHIDEEKGRTLIDAAVLNPLARLGGSEYAFLGDYVNLKRPA
jgi:flavin reductase (DIM6/NTAB) family NADH-FMN oxidoreductase RutF